MVKPDDRVAETGKEALDERGRHFAAHGVVRRGRRGGEHKRGERQTRGAVE